MTVLRVAPVGLCPYCLHLTQSLVALTGLRTLGFEGGAPLGALLLRLAHSLLSVSLPLRDTLSSC